MAESAEGAGFWLPSEFFDDFQVDKENLNKNTITESDPEFRFPTEFPFDFATKTDQLTEKRWLMSTSPQSTLSHMSSWAGRSAGGSTNGSPSGFQSPPTTPKNDAVGDLVYLAAGQVARMKLHGGDVTGPTKPKGLTLPPRSLRDPSAIPIIYQQQQMVKQQKQGCEMWQQMYQMRNGQDAWPVQQNPARLTGLSGRAAVFGNGGAAAAKRGCAGTGVFLPRRYGNSNNHYNDCNAYSSDSYKRPGYPASSIIPNRNVQALNKNLESMNGFTQSQPLYPPKLGRAFVPEYDLLMARRNALMLQHQRSLLLEGSSPMSHGAYLPPEWTY